MKALVSKRVTVNFLENCRPSDTPPAPRAPRRSSTKLLNVIPIPNHGLVICNARNANLSFERKLSVVRN